jgi:O-antigen/teichoic acid export membrane protein
MRRRLAFGIASMAYGKSVTALIQLAMVPVLATTWGVELFGQWLLLSTIPAFLVASDFGFGTAAGNRLIGEIADNRQSEALTTFQSALLMIASCAAVVAVVGLAIAAVIPDSFLALPGVLDGSAVRKIVIVLTVYGLVGMLGILFIAAMRSHGAFARSTTFEATVQLAEGLAVIGVALAGEGPLQAALALLAVRSCGLMGHVALALHHAPWLKLGFGTASRERTRELFRPAIAAMMLPLASAGYLQGTALAVGAAAGAAAVPIYTSLRTLSRVILQLLMAVNLPILPEFTAAFAKGNREWVMRAAGGIGSFNALAGIGGAVGFGLLGEWLFVIWTNGTIAPPLAMIWLTAAAIAAGTTWNPLSNLLLAVNRHERFTFWFVAAAAAGIGLTYLAVQQFGVTGAALANLALDLFMLVCVVRMVGQEFGRLPFGWRAMAILLPKR